MPFPGTAGESLRPPDAAVDARQSRRAKQKVEASYLAGQLSWSADYVLTVNRDETTADLDGWVTLVNNSGTAFQERAIATGGRRTESRATRQAQFEALKSDGRRTPRWLTQQRRSSRKPSANITCTRWAAAPACSTTRASRSACSTPRGIPLLKTYEVDGQYYYYRSVDAARRADERSGAGLLQIQKRGEIEPGHAAAGRHDSRLSSRLARQRAFRRRRPHRPHAQGRRSQPAHRQRLRRRRRTQADRLQSFAAQVHEMEYEITLRNHKDMPITVEVNEPIGGDWEMLDSTYK